MFRVWSAIDSSLLNHIMVLHEIVNTSYVFSISLDGKDIV